MAIELGSIVWIGAAVGVVAAAYGVLRVVAAGTAGTAAPDSKDLVATPMPKLPLLARPWIALPLISLAGLAIVAIGNRPQSRALEKTETKQPLQPAVETPPKSDLEDVIKSAERDAELAAAQSAIQAALAALLSGMAIQLPKDGGASRPSKATTQIPNTYDAESRARQQLPAAGSPR